VALGRICRYQDGAICTDCKSSCRLDNQRRAEKSKRHGLTTSRWQRLRTAALRRDRFLCQLRLSGCTQKATTVHLRPELAGDHLSASLGDLSSCCAHCHGAVDAPRARR
jgi:5-methylcytosine-specific restriction endonuclease McrA